MPETEQPRVHVDFNDMDSEGRFFVLPEDVEGGTLGLRSPVVLVDEEGNRALGHVAELMERGQALIAMAAGSWQRAAAAVQETRSVQDQVFQLLGAPIRRTRPAADWYRLSVVPSNVVIATAAPASGLPEPHGAVPSTL